MCSVDPFSYFAYKNKGHISAEVRRVVQSVTAEIGRQADDVNDVLTGGAGEVRDQVREQRNQREMAERQAIEAAARDKRRARKLEDQGLRRLLQSRYRAQRAIRGASSTGGARVNFGGGQQTGRTLLGS